MTNPAASTKRQTADYICNWIPGTAKRSNLQIRTASGKLIAILTKPTKETISAAIKAHAAVQS